MKSPYILRESTLKRDRSGKQKRVETLLIESFSDIATRSHYSQALIIGAKDRSCFFGYSLFAVGRAWVSVSGSISCQKK